jgi:four helix bundle protein
MNENELKARMKAFALRIIRLVRALPKTPEGRAIAGQLVRSGMSVGANYRSACRARSKAEFVSRLGIVEEEADESAYWLELLADGRIVKADLLEPLLKEANEIVAIVSASRISAAGRESKIANRKSEIGKDEQP